MCMQKGSSLLFSLSSSLYYFLLPLYVLYFTLSSLFPFPPSLCVPLHPFPLPLQVRSHRLGQQDRAHSGGGEPAEQTKPGAGCLPHPTEPNLHPLPAWQLYLHHDQRGAHTLVLSPIPSFQTGLGMRLSHARGFPSI